MEDQVRQAIAELRVAEVVRKGDPARNPRIVEPHILYESSKGKVLVDCYQTSGYSSAGDLPGWRPVDVLLIQSLKLREERFEPRRVEGYNPRNRKRYRRILAKV